MVSRHLSGAIRVHGNVLRQIATLFGSRPFSAAELKVRGVPLVAGGTMTALHRSGCVERVARDRRGRAVWRLAPELTNYYAAQEVST